MTSPRRAPSTGARPMTITGSTRSTSTSRSRPTTWPAPIRTPKRPRIRPPCRPRTRPRCIACALILANNQKHTDKAVTYAKALQATNPTDAGVISQITVAYYLRQGFPRRPGLVQKQIDAAAAAGKTPARDTLQNLLDTRWRRRTKPAPKRRWRHWSPATTIPTTGPR